MNLQNIANSTAWFSGLALLLWGVGAVLTWLVMCLDPYEPLVPITMGLRNENYDVLYLGNSIPCQAINPSVIDADCNTHSFNMAIGGSTMIEMEMILRHYLTHNEKPSLVVVGIAPNRWARGDGLRPTVKLSLSPEQLNFYQDYLGSETAPWRDTLAKDLLIRLPAYRFRAGVERLLKYLFDGKKRVPKYIQGHLALDVSRAIPKKVVPHKARVNEKALSSLLSYCGEEGITTLVIEPPNSPVFNESVLGREVAMESVARCISRHKGVRFISFNYENTPPFVAGDWVALNHLNAQGAVKFSKYFAPTIAATLNAQKDESLKRSDQ